MPLGSDLSFFPRLWSLSLACFLGPVHQRGFVDGRITAERVMFERRDGLQPVHLLLSFMSRIAPAAYEPIEDKVE